jgi:hypothetical protein
VAFVERSMDVYQGRPDLPAAEVDALDSIAVLSAGPNARDLAIIDREVRAHHAFAVGWRE